MADTDQPQRTLPFTAKDFRSALGAFATGVTVITTQSATIPTG